GEYSDVQGQRHRSRRRALVGRARSRRPSAADRRTPDRGPQSRSRLGRVRDAPRAAGCHGVPCLAGAVPSLDRERHGALGRHCQVGRNQRPVTEAASTGPLLSPPVSPSDPLVWADFQALCDLGGRVAGSASEAAALAFARQRLAAVPGATVRDDPVDYPGWRGRTAQLVSAGTGGAFPCTPLLGTASAAGGAAGDPPLPLGREGALWGRTG